MAHHPARNPGGELLCHHLKPTSLMDNKSNNHVMRWRVRPLFFLLVNFQNALIFLNHKTPQNWIDESDGGRTSVSGCGGGENSTLSRSVRQIAGGGIPSAVGSTEESTCVSTADGSGTRETLEINMVVTDKQKA
jgi:hypothetical protein